MLQLTNTFFSYLPSPANYLPSVDDVENFFVENVESIVDVIDGVLENRFFADEIEYIAPARLGELSDVAQPVLDL